MLRMRIFSATVFKHANPSDLLLSLSVEGHDSENDEIPISKNNGLIN